MRFVWDLAIAVSLFVGVCLHYLNYQESLKIQPSELSWKIGSNLICEFPVLLETVDNNYVVDQAKFDCKVVAFERAELVKMPHYTLDCSKSRMNTFLNLKFPKTIVFSYLHEPENCYYK